MNVLLKYINKLLDVYYSKSFIKNQNDKLVLIIL